MDELVLLEGIDDDDEESYVDEYADYDDDEEDFLEDELDDDDDDDEEEEEEEEGGNDGLNQNMGSFWSSAPSGKMDEKYSQMADLSLSPGLGDLSDVPDDAFVSDEDTRSLKKAHKRADRIIEHAADVALIASFHYKKKNYHLVKLLEPIFIIGKRINDIKGYYFTLLDEKEGARSYFLYI